jgi:hypothetical protein
LAAAAWVPQFAQRLPFNLANALAGKAKFLSYFFQRVAASVLQTKAQA